MYELKINTSATVVSYDDYFYYTFNLYKSNNDINFNSLILSFTIPSYIEYSLPLCENLKSNVTILDDGSDLISLDFSSLSPNKVALFASFTVSCRFLISSPKNSNFTLESYLNNKAYLAPNVTLSIKPKYILTLSLYSPAYVSCSSGDRLVYHGLLQNLGDRDIVSNYIKLNINLSKNLFLTLDKDFKIIGNDVSPLPLLDIISLDSSITLLNNNKGFILNLDNYTGDSYEFYFSAHLTNAASRGHKIELSIPWEFNGITMPPAYHMCKVDLPVEHANLYVLGPIYMSNSSYLYAYTLNISGNKALPYSNITYELSDMNLLSLKITTGIYSIASIYPNENILYKISYTLVSSPDEDIFISNGEDSVFNTSISSTIIFDNEFLKYNSIKNITLHFHKLKTGLVSVSPLIFIINSSDKDSDINNVNLSGRLTSNSGYSCNLIKYPGTTHDISLPKLSHITSNTLYKPGMDIDIISSIDICFDHLYDLTYYTFVPIGFKLKYIDLISNFEFIYSHNFINSSSLPAFITPSIETIDNTPLGTLIKLDFSSNIFLAGGNLTIKYKLLPLSYFTGKFTHYSLISSPGINIYTTNIGMDSNILTNSIFNTMFNNISPVITSESIYLYINNISMCTHTLESKNDVLFSSSSLCNRLLVSNVGNTYINSLTIKDINKFNLLHLLLLDSHSKNIISSFDHPIIGSNYVDTNNLILNNLNISPKSTLGMLFSTSATNDSNNSNDNSLLSYDIYTTFNDNFSSVLGPTSPYPIQINSLNKSSYINLNGYISSGDLPQSSARLQAYNDLDDVIILLYKVQDGVGKLSGSTIVSRDSAGNYFDFSFDVNESGDYFIRFIGPNSSIYKLKVTSINDELFLKINSNGFSDIFPLTNAYSPYQLDLQIRSTYGFTTLKNVSNSSRSLVKNVIKSQLLLNMKLEDIVNSFLQK